MIPIIFVTGFLGSGKTSLLSDLVSRNSDRPLAYLVNEFSPVDVDGQRLDLPTGRLTTIAGGSIFCKCRVSDFIRALQKIQQRQEESETVDGVVIEASGMANPQVLGRMLKETGLNQHYALRTVLTLVDPGNLHKLVKTLPNVIAQIEMADLVLLNKIDCYSDEELAAAQKLIEELQPTGEIVRTTYGRLTADPFNATGHQVPESGDYARCADPHYVEAHLSLPAMVDWPAFKKKITNASALLYRAKGQVSTATGTLVVDWSSSGWHETERADSPTRTSSELVIIGKGEDSDSFAELIQELEDSLLAPNGERNL